MKHAYLSEALVQDALKHNQITQQEAEKLKKKIHTQLSLFKPICK